MSSETWIGERWARRGGALIVFVESRVDEGNISPPHFGGLAIRLRARRRRTRKGRGQAGRRDLWASRPFLICGSRFLHFLLSFLQIHAHTHTYLVLCGAESTAIHSSLASDQLAPPDFPNFPNKVVVSHPSRLSPSSRSSQLAGNGRTRLPQCSYAPRLEAQ